MGQICQFCEYRSFAASFLNEEQLYLLDNNCNRVQFKKGEIIFKQDFTSTNISYLITGLVKLHMKGFGDKQYIIKIVKSSNYISIPTSIGDEVNHYSATAIDECSVCFIDLDIFKNLILSNQKFAFEIILNMCKDELIQYQSCLSKAEKNIRGLIADTLLNFSNNIFQSNQFILPISRSEIANLINSSRESVCRILSEFHKDKIIQITGRKITILNIDRLIKISDNG